LVSLYADDAALFYADNPMVAGKDAIRETWKAIFAGPGFAMSTELLKVEISSSGDSVFAHGAYNTVMNGATSKPVTDEGEYAVVYKKNPDGKWKIVADNGNSDLRAHSLPKSPDRRQHPVSSLAPLLGLACLFSGLWFLFGMPLVLAVFARKCFQSHKLPTGFLVSVVMIIVFFASAVLLWRHFATHYWNLSFLTALQAAGDAARYGHPVEHTAEVLLVNLLIFSTLSAAAAGAITGAVRHLWVRRRSLAM
jgi:ketosteroid isomerase-like protein